MRKPVLFAVALGAIAFVPSARAVNCKKEFEKARTIDQFKKLVAACPDMAAKIQDVIAGMRQAIEREKLESEALAALKKSGSGFTIPIVIDQKLAIYGEIAGKSITAGETGFLMTHGDSVAQIGGKAVPPLADYSIWRFVGNVDLGRLRPLGAPGYTVIGEGDNLNTLTFCIAPVAGPLMVPGQRALAYLRGKGRVITDTGSETKLGYE